MTHVLQLKIVLQGIEPPIWRTVQVTDDITFETLHNVIQDVMGWFNYHLYEFDINGKRIGVPDEFAGELDVAGADEIELSEYLQKEGQEIMYTYDMGDNWVHSVEVEKIMPFDEEDDLPRCIAGARNCPPEDCGGAPGYLELLEILSNDQHPQHEDLMEWMEEDFDPEYFDLNEVNELLEDYEEDWEEE